MMKEERKRERRFLPNSSCLALYLSLTVKSLL